MEVQGRGVAVGNGADSAGLAQRAAAQLFLRELVPRLCLNAVYRLVVRVQVHSEPVQALAKLEIKLCAAVVMLIKQQRLFRRGLGEQHGAVVQVQLSPFARKPMLRFILRIAIELIEVVPITLYPPLLRDDRGLAGPPVSLCAFGVLTNEAAAGRVAVKGPNQMRQIVGS
ncbi:hypothetical protein D3C86_1432210 [compost metagenome]